ncbi:MAG: helix-turn-helix domain-containing protein, partial [Gammaproteobacteria bacterium]
MSCALTGPDPVSEDVMLTTTEAGRLIGRTGNAVRKAVSAGHLQGTWDRDHWLVSASAVLAWAARTPPGHGPQLPVP